MLRHAINRDDDIVPRSRHGQRCFLEQLLMGVPIILVKPDSRGALKFDEIEVDEVFEYLAVPCICFCITGFFAAIRLLLIEHRKHVVIGPKFKIKSRHRLGEFIFTNSRQDVAEKILQTIGFHGCGR